MAPAVSAVAVNALRYTTTPGGERKGGSSVAAAGKTTQVSRVEGNVVACFLFLENEETLNEFAKRR